MTIKKGTLVRIGTLLSLNHLTNQLGNVHKELGQHEAFDDNGKPFTIFGYGVTMHNDGKTVIVGECAVFAEPPPSSRGDLDLLVDWTSLGYKRRPYPQYQPKGEIK